MADKKTAKRGFASMNPNRRKLIASRGGIVAHLRGTAYVFDSETASRAGRIGGKKTSQDREHMAKIGRIGGKKSRSRELRNKSGDDNVADGAELA